MQLAREGAERLLDVGFARAAIDAEQLVVVAPRRRHRRKTLAFAVYGLGEARELARGRADRTERLLVIHPDRTDQADRAERTVHEAVARADERDLLERRVVQLVAEADERAPRLGGGVPEDVQERRALLDELEQVAVGLE